MFMCIHVYAMYSHRKARGRLQELVTLFFFETEFFIETLMPPVRLGWLDSELVPGILLFLSSQQWALKHKLP